MPHALTGCGSGRRVRLAPGPMCRVQAITRGAHLPAGRVPLATDLARAVGVDGPIRLKKLGRLLVIVVTEIPH